MRKLRSGACGLPGRSGFTLVELMASLVLAAIVGSLAVMTVRDAAKLEASESAALAVARELATVSGVLRDGLTGSRWEVTSPLHVRFDRKVGEGPVCRVAGNRLYLDGQRWQSRRAIDPGRDLALVRGGDVDLVVAIVDVAGDLCPGGKSAIRLELPGGLPSVPGWVEAVEPSELRLYHGGGGRTIGLVGVLGGGSVQPVADSWHADLSPLVELAGPSGPAMFPSLPGWPPMAFPLPVGSP